MLLQNLYTFTDSNSVVQNNANYIVESSSIDLLTIGTDGSTFWNLQIVLGYQSAIWMFDNQTDFDAAFAGIVAACGLQVVG